MESLPDDEEKLRKVIKLISENKQLAQNLILTAMKTHYDDEEYWKHIISITILSDDFILDKLDKINLKFVIKYQKLSEDVINNRKFMKYVIDNDLINILITYQKVNEETLNYLIISGYIDDEFWNLICTHQKLSGNFIKSHDDNINWKAISTHQDLNMEIITDYLDKIDWNSIPLNITSGLLINDNTIKLYEKYPIWNNVANLRNVSTDKIFEYFDKFDINSIWNILKFRQLTDDQLNVIINKYYNDDEIWLLISENQTISEPILNKYSDKLNWLDISENYDFTSEDIIKYDNKINYNKLSYNDNFTTEWLKSIKLNNKVDQLDKKYLIENDIIEKSFF